MARHLTEQDIAKIVKLRGLGYSQAEIAERLGVSQSTINYRLEGFKARAERDGVDDTYLALLIGAGIGIGAGVVLAKLLEKK